MACTQREKRLPTPGSSGATWASSRGQSRCAVAIRAMWQGALSPGRSDSPVPRWPVPIPPAHPGRPHFRWPAGRSSRAPVTWRSSWAPTRPPRDSSHRTRAGAPMTPTGCGSTCSEPPIPSTSPYTHVAAWRSTAPLPPTSPPSRPRTAATGYITRMPALRRSSASRTWPTRRSCPTRCASSRSAQPATAVLPWWSPRWTMRVASV